MPCREDDTVSTGFRLFFSSKLVTCLSMVIIVGATMKTVVLFTFIYHFRLQYKSFSALVMSAAEDGPTSRSPAARCTNTALLARLPARHSCVTPASQPAHSHVVSTSW